MNNPFANSYKDQFADAKRNAIQSEDDLAASFLETTGAAFDLTFNEGRTTTRMENIVAKVSERSEQMAQDLNKQSKFVGRMGDTSIWATYRGLVKNKDLYERMERAYLEGVENLNEEDRFFIEEFGKEFDAYSYVQDQIKANPDKYKTDKALIEEVRSEMKAVSAEAKQTLARSDDLLPQFIGGAGAVFTDPAVVSTLPFGGEFAWVRSGHVLAQIGKGALTTGAISAGTEALAQADIAETKRFLGEKFTFFDGLQNIAMAGAGGSVLYAGLRGTGETIGFIRNMRKNREALDGVKLTGEEQAAAVVFKDFTRVLDSAEELYGKGITSDQLQTHIRMTKEADEYLSNFNHRPHIKEEPIVTATDDIATPSDKLYDELLTPSDKAYDKEIMAQLDEALKEDMEIPIRMTLDEKGEQLMEFGSAKETLKKLDDDLAALDGIKLCMAGKS